MHDPINLGPGLAAAVTIVDERVYVAFGVQPDALVLVAFTLAGVEVQRAVFTDGFFNSFPRFSGRWLVYKRNHDWRPAALNVQTGQRWTFRGQADGNFGVVAYAAMDLIAYQWTARYDIWLGSLLDGDDAPTSMRGAPDGLDTLVDPGRVTLRKDTRLSVPGMLYPVRAGDLTVGELADDPSRPNGGVGVQLAGDLVRVALPGQDAPTPSCATEGDTYAIVTGGPHGVRLLLPSRAELLGLAPADRVPGPVVNLPPTSNPAPPDPEPPPRVPAPTDPVPPHHPGPTPAPSAPPAVHEGDFLMFSTFTDPTKRVLAVKAVKPVGSSGTVLENVDGTIVSIQPSGEIESRPAGADGGYERCKVSGNAATFKPAEGKYFTFAFVVVEGL